MAKPQPWEFEEYSPVHAPFALWPRRDQTIPLVKAVKEYLGVDKTDFYRLLGVPPYTSTYWYQWTGKNGRVVPSSKYLARMLELVMLKIQGKLDIATFNGHTYWKERYEHTNNGHVATVPPQKVPNGKRTPGGQVPARR